MFGFSPRRVFTAEALRRKGAGRVHHKVHKGHQGVLPRRGVGIEGFTTCLPQAGKVHEGHKGVLTADLPAVGKDADLPAVGKDAKGGVF